MADELIKRSAAIEALCSKGRKAWDTLAVDDVRIIIQADAVEALMQLTPVDAVPVVRCSTCRCYDMRNDPSGETSDSHPYCHRFCDYVDSDGYCKWGKRKVGKDEDGTD